MKITKLKCEKCEKEIEGCSQKEAEAWMAQHIHFKHPAPSLTKPLFSEETAK